MANFKKEKSGCRPARYQIKVNGKFQENWSDWLGGLEIFTDKDGGESQVTTLVGIVSDQAALRGILGRVWDLNLTVLSVFRFNLDAEQPADLEAGIQNGVEDNNSPPSTLNSRLKKE